MSKHYRVHTLKYLAAGGTAVVSLGAAALMLYLREWAGVVLFLLIAGLFAWIAMMYGAVITVGTDEIRKTFWGIPLGKILWKDVREVGVVGTKIFMDKDTKRSGSRYLYFSPDKLDEDGRFKMAMEWPPRNMIYLIYTKERLEQIQAVWSQVIETYNAGDVFF